MKNETLKDYINTYPEGYFDLFGSEKDIDMAMKGLPDYSTQEKERVKEIILHTRRKYGYLFSK